MKQPKTPTEHICPYCLNDFGALINLVTHDYIGKCKAINGVAL